MAGDGSGISMAAAAGQNPPVSMVTEYVRLRPHELARLRHLLAEDPDEAYDYAGDLQLGDDDDEMSSRGMDIDRRGRAYSTY
jgi:hypothetical protein